MTGKKKSVQDAAVQKPSEQPSSEKEISLDTEAPGSSRQTEQPSKPTAIPFDRATIENQLKSSPFTKGAIKYVGPIFDYLESIEARLQAADQNFVKIGAFLDRMEPLVKLGEQIQQRQTQGIGTTAGPPQTGFDISSLLQLAPAILGGGGADEDMRGFQKEIMKLNIESMREAIDFSKAVKGAVVAKITAGALTT